MNEGTAKQERIEALENMMLPVNKANGVNRSLDQVATDMRRYVDDGRLSEEDYGQLIWLFSHGKEKHLKGWDDYGKLVSYSGSTISRLFSGDYVGALDKVVDAVRGYRHLNAEREKMATDDFIETSIWEKIRGVCDLAVLRSSPIRIVGPSQIGKTHSLLEYKRRATTPVFYCRVPAVPTFRSFMNAVAEACSVNVSLRSEDLRMRIPRALNRNTLLVVDELHELVLSASKGTAMRCMEWLREVWDLSHCGLAACGTRSMEDDLINGAGLKGWLDQFDQRCIRTLSLPLSLPEDDIKLAAENYGFPAPDASVRGLLQTIRMNRLCSCLTMAASVSNKRGEPRTWDLFKRVYKKNFGTGVGL